MYFTTIRTRALCEQERRRNLSSTFTEPLENPSSSLKLPSTSQSPSSEPSPPVPKNELGPSLETSNQAVATPEEKAKNEKEMEEHPVLRTHFEILVPQIVSYEDFWKRYYYRCYDLNRIVSDLNQQDERKECAKEPEEMKNSATLEDVYQQQLEVKSSASRKEESFESVQGRILHMASSPVIQPKQIEKEETIKEDVNPNLTSTFDSSLTFGSASFNVIPIDETRTHTQTIAEPTSETPREYPLFPVEKEEADYRRNNHEGIVEADTNDDGDSLGSLSFPQVPDFLSECTSVVTNPDHIHRYPDSPDFYDQNEEGETSKAESPALESQDEVSETETASALDDRLAGASVFILNDEILEPDDELMSKIVAMGGKVTEKLKGATHALWVPPNAESDEQRQESWNKFNDTVIVTLAEKYNVPIVDSDRWLPEIVRLEFEEHWSDVNSADFHPERTQATISRSPKRYKVFNKPDQDITTKEHRPSPNKKKRSISNSSFSKKREFQVVALINILVLVVALSVGQSAIFLPTTPITKGRRWSIFRGGSTVPAKKSKRANTSGKKNKKTTIPWWKKLLDRIKVHQPLR